MWEVMRALRSLIHLYTPPLSTSLNQNLLQRGRFIAIQAYLKKQEKSQVNNLTLHLKQLEKEKVKNSRVSRRKEILKIMAEKKCKRNKRDHSKNQQGQKLVL